MVKYRRNRLTGGTYFFTVNLHYRKTELLTTHIELLRDAFRKTIKQQPFYIDAIVILPDHIHTIWTLPEGDDNYPQRWQAIKSQFTRSLKTAEKGLTKNKRGEYAVWQRRYWEHTIKNSNDLQRHIDYIHFNPVKHKHVRNVIDWQYSSFQQYVARGKLPATWGREYRETKEEHGE